MLVDAHCHLHDPRLRDALHHSQLLRRATAVNVTHVVSCACFAADWDALEALLRRWEDDCSAALGGSSSRSSSDLGEIGLCSSRRGQAVDAAVQERAFVEQLRLAVELNRTCVLHCVGRYGKLLELLLVTHRETKRLPPRIVLHSYGGSAQQAAAFLALEKRAPGTRIFFSLNVKQLTDSRFDKAAATCAAVPLSALLLETDAPDQVPEISSLERFMKPEGALGIALDATLAASHGLNEPALVAVAYARAAEIREVELSHLAAAVRSNALAAFALPS
ncbi:hypothetical protein PybrP1_006408 [[Pythium] brassicae (nom. inval.)]|nr:hypothetical protein PybrP1_006408 [[Pythium] brassicae (nom. inval.)]